MHLKNIFTIGTYAAVLIFSVIGNASAATFPLSSSDPDVTTFGATLDYVFTEAIPEDQCYQKDQSSGTYGPCGTGGGGPNGFSGDPVTAADAFGALSIDTTFMALSDSDVGGSNNVANFTGVYALDATFDDTGAFVSGTLSIQYTGISGSALAGPALNDYLLTANLYDFALNGTGTALEIEFLGDTVAGWMINTYGGTYAGIIAGATISGHTGTWVQSDFLASFSGSTSSDSFAPANGGPSAIPLPGAVWLFGSGLLGLIGLGRKRIHKSV